MTILPVILHGWKEGWRDYFLEEIVSQQNEVENHDLDYWMIYWAPIINTQILGPDHRDTLEAIEYSKPPNDKGYPPIPLSLLNLEIADRLCRVSRGRR